MPDSSPEKMVSLLGTRNREHGYKTPLFVRTSMRTEKAEEFRVWTMRSRLPICLAVLIRDQVRLQVSWGKGLDVPRPWSRICPRGFREKAPKVGDEAAHLGERPDKPYPQRRRLQGPTWALKTGASKARRRVIDTGFPQPSEWQRQCFAVVWRSCSRAQSGHMPCEKSQ